MRIPISEIKINPGRREADPAHINELSQSIADVGLLNPITVDSSHTLIAGLHRLEAAKLLDWTEIECTVCDIDNIRAELAEIDENVIRRNLSDTEFSRLLVRRKTLYEKLHPKAIARNRPGHVNNHQSSSDNLMLEPKAKSFVEDTAEKPGVSTRMVERRLWLAEHLTPKTEKILSEMDKLKPSLGQLMKLAHLEPDRQVEAASMLASGSIKTVDEYLKQAEPEPPEVMAPCPNTYYDDFMSFSKEVLKNLEHFCVQSENAPALSSEQAIEVQAQIGKLHEAMDALAARFTEAR